MTQQDPDRALKRVWLVIGVLVLPLLVSVLFMAGRELVSGWFDSDRRTAVAAPTDGTDPVPGGPRRAVRFDLPVAVGRTGTRIAIVRHGAAFEPEGNFLPEPQRAMARSGGSYESYENGPIVNVAVLPGDGKPYRLIFDRAVFIFEVGYPGRQYPMTDTLQTWITYEVAERDTDGNERLDRQDRRTLYVTDLEGVNLRRVLPEGWLINNYGTQADHRSIVITAFQGPAPGAKDWSIEKAPQRAFIYNVAAGQLQPFTALDSLATRAGLLLAAPRSR